MKTLLVLLVVIMVSCAPKSSILPKPLAPAEKVVIIEREANMDHYGMLRYKVKRLNSSTLTYIQISYLTEYEPKDTILWRF